MKRIFIDAEKCDGCLSCAIACMNAHRAEEGSVYTLNLGDIENESRNHIQPKTPLKMGYLPIFCRHCAEPECAMSCMSGALAKNKETGYVEYDSKRCGACFMCVMNCPYGVLKPDEKTHSMILKCDFCKDKGYEPSCVNACPKEAIVVKEVAE